MLRSRPWHPPPTVPVMYDPPVLRTVVARPGDRGGSKRVDRIGHVLRRRRKFYLHLYHRLGRRLHRRPRNSPTIIYAGGGSALLVGQFGDTSPYAYSPASITCPPHVCTVTGSTTSASDTQTIQLTVDSSLALQTDTLIRIHRQVNAHETYTCRQCISRALARIRRPSTGATARRTMPP